MRIASRTHCQMVMVFELLVLILVYNGYEDEVGTSGMYEKIQYRIYLYFFAVQKKKKIRNIYILVDSLKKTKIANSEYNR